MLRTKTKAFSTVSVFSKVSEKNSIFNAVYSGHKRHTVVSSTDDANANLSSFTEDFTIFRKKILPQLELSVEKRMMQKYKLNLQPEEHISADLAYLRLRQRKQEMLAKELQAEAENQGNSAAAEEIEINRFTRQIESALPAIIADPKGKFFSHHNFSTIGKYSVLPDNLSSQWLSDGGCGGYSKNFLGIEGKYGIMCREEGLRIANLLKLVKTEDEMNVPIKAILNGKFDVKQGLKETEFFSEVFQLLSHSLLDEIHKIENENIKYVFSSTDVFDGLVGMLINGMKKKHFGKIMLIPSERQRIMEQIVGLMVFEFENEGYTLNFKEVIERLKKIKVKYSPEAIQDYAKELGVKEMKTGKGTFDLYLESLYLPCQKHWRPEKLRQILDGNRGFNSGMFIHGKAGTGKSMVLNYIRCFAKENDWIVACVPNGTTFSRDETRKFEAHECGLFLQYEVAQEWLSDFKVQNMQQLRDFEINSEIYGNCNFAGVQASETAVPVFYDPYTKSYTDDWKKIEEALKADPADHEQFAEFREEKPFDFDHNKGVSNMLPSPKNLLELVDYGIENGRLATSVIGEVLTQLYRSDKFKTLVVVDEYNDWFRPSGYPSFRYANNKGYWGRVPPYDIALVRLFMKFDGHMIKNGMKIFASSTGKWFKHDFDPKQINFLKYYTVEMEPLKLDEVRNALVWYSGTGVNEEVLYENSVEHIYSNSQGNWFELQKRLNNEFFEKSNLHDYQLCLNTHFNWKKWKKEKKYFKK